MLPDRNILNFEKLLSTSVDETGTYMKYGRSDYIVSSSCLEISRRTPHIPSRGVKTGYSRRRLVGTF